MLYAQGSCRIGTRQLTQRSPFAVLWDLSRASQVERSMETIRRLFLISRHIALRDACGDADVNYTIAEVAPSPFFVERKRPLTTISASSLSHFQRENLCWFFHRFLICAVPFEGYSAPRSFPLVFPFPLSLESGSRVPFE